MFDFPNVYMMSCILIANL